VISLAIPTHKKIVPYDEETAETIASMQSCGQLLIPRDNYAPMEDLNRLRAQDIIVLMLGYGVKLYHKIALLAAGQNEGRQVLLNALDTFVVGLPEQRQHRNRGDRCARSALSFRLPGLQRPEEKIPQDARLRRGS
jgi:hypothetical protein